FVNIISSDYFYFCFSQFLSRLIRAIFFSLLASLLVLWLYFRKAITKSFDANHIKKPIDAINDIKLYKISWIVLVIL
ncbi:ArsB/NhaD family transporter, partial [Staphylococcus aureus]|nr:ArsB/NhaD family transporter [Staphylococcus aureus]